MSLTVGIYHSYKNAQSKTYWDSLLKSLRISSTALIMLVTVTIFQMLQVPSAQFDAFRLVPFSIILSLAWYFKVDTRGILLLSGVIGIILF